MDELILGIDTSNYRTSVCLVDTKGNIVYNHRKLLDVPKGERGLRQSEAFFQHVQRLPEIISEVMAYRTQIIKIAVSTRPRPVSGSYMPCFTAGVCCAKELAAALNVPLNEYSHQEGHVESIRFGSAFHDDDNIICFHFSGGTTEALYKNEIVGGTLDLAYGQVIDRAGVSLGYPFPSGEYLDRIACGSQEPTNILKPLRLKDGFVNLSGIETQFKNNYENYLADSLAKELFLRLAKSIMDMTDYLHKKYHVNKFIYAGGVSCSNYIRDYLRQSLPKDIEYVFGEPELSGDNACGICYLALREGESIGA